MKDGYISYVLEEYIADGNFDAVFGDEWVDAERLAELSTIVCDYAFADYGIDAKGKYTSQVEAIFEGLKANNGIVGQGDEYSDFWYKLRIPHKAKYLEQIRAKNPATSRIDSLGVEALRRALNKIVVEDGLRSMEEKWAEANDPETSQTPADEVTEGIPASDRIVSLDHNRPEYVEIASTLDDAIELADKTRPNEVSGDQHASLIIGLRAARELWKAFELTQMQIEIGIIMALERVQKALSVSFRTARGSLLVEGIKEFVSAMKQIDF